MQENYETARKRIIANGHYGIFLLLTWIFGAFLAFIVIKAETEKLTIGISIMLGYSIIAYLFLHIIKPKK